MSIPRLSPATVREQWLGSRDFSFRGASASPPFVPWRPDWAERALRTHGPLESGVYAYGWEQLAFVAWLQEYSQVKVLPVPVSRSGRDGQYSPCSCAVNASRVAGKRKPRSYTRTPVSADLLRVSAEEWADAPRHSSATVAAAWVAELPTTVQRKLESGVLARKVLEHHADDLSWPELRCLSLAWWVRLYADAPVFPVPSPQVPVYHPRAWVVNADSPAASADKPKLAAGQTLPKPLTGRHLTKSDFQDGTAPRLVRADNDAPEVDTATSGSGEAEVEAEDDPFAEFR